MKSKIFLCLLLIMSMLAFAGCTDGTSGSMVPDDNGATGINNNGGNGVYDQNGTNGSGTNGNGNSGNGTGGNGGTIVDDVRNGVLNDDNNTSSGVTNNMM